MVLDIIIIAILIFAAIYGYAKGFVFTLIHTVGWIVSLVGAYFLTPLVVPYAKEYTGFYSWLTEGFNYRFGESSAGINASEGSIPQSLSGLFGDIFNDAISKIADAFSTLVLSIAVFIIIFIIIKLILWLILRTLSKEYNGNVGVVDGILGILIGIVKGLIITFIFLTLLLPLINLMAPDFTEGVTASLDNSYIAKTLYDNNILLTLMQSLFTGN